MIDYREEIENSKEVKERYLDGIESLILKRQKDAAKKRGEYAKEIFRDPERYRRDFVEMLGWPLTDRGGEPIIDPKSEKLADYDGYSIYRMSFEILDGVMMSGLYYEHSGDDVRPLVIVQHGGRGTPEAISGFYGSTTNYNHMLERVLVRGADVFAPQLLLWNQETYNLQFDRIAIDSRLKRVGSSITAIELYGIMRILDYFEAKPTVSSFGMVGLSYGGFYTLFLSAIDTRIKSAICCAFFNTRDAYPWSDWTWLRSAELFDDPEIACLVYPRKLCLEIGNVDLTFNYASGIESYAKLKELCKPVGTDWLTLISFDGNHEFCNDDAPIDALISHL